MSIHAAIGVLSAPATKQGLKTSKLLGHTLKSLMAYPLEKHMNMLARPIPEQLRAAMEAPDAIDLGWARNFNIITGPNVRWGYPGWDLLKKHCPLADVVTILNEYNQDFNTTVKEDAPNRRAVLNPASWEELEEAINDQAYPILQGLMRLLVKATNKTIYVTKVSFGDGAGVFEGIDVYWVTPEGRAIMQQV